MASLTPINFGGHRDPCTHREALRELGMLIAQECLLWKRYQSNTYIPSRKLRVEVVNYLVTVLLSEGTGLTPMSRNDYPRLFPP